MPVLLGNGRGAESPGAVPVPSGTMAPALAGAVLGPLEPEHPAYGLVEGIAVTAVEPGSAADRAGLRAGDVISAVNRAAIASKAELDAEMAATSGAVALTVWRDGRDLLVLFEA